MQKPGQNDVARRRAGLRAEIQYEMEQIQRIHAVFASPLYADDQFLRQFRSTMHQLTVSRLLSALDHLQLAAHTLDNENNGLVFSQYSLVRPALAVASTALWLVRGDRNDRRLRALNLASYDLAQQVAFAKTILEAPDRPDARNEAQKQECQAVTEGAPARFHAMYEKYCSILAIPLGNMSQQKELRKFRETEVIAEISKYCYELGRLSNPQEILIQYRMTSGFVHGLLWSTYAGAKVRNFQGEKSAMVELKGNPENIYRAARTALVVVRIAKARFIELCEYSG